MIETAFSLLRRGSRLDLPQVKSHEGLFLESSSRFHFNKNSND